MIAKMLWNCYVCITYYLPFQQDIKYKIKQLLPTKSDVEYMKIDRDIYDLEVNYYNDNNEDNDYSKSSNAIPYMSIQSSASTFQKYDCGYCMNRIGVPVHMYNDEAFCNNFCRHKKMEFDRNIRQLPN